MFPKKHKKTDTQFSSTNIRTRHIYYYLDDCTDNSHLSTYNVNSIVATFDENEQEVLMYTPSTGNRFIPLYSSQNDMIITVKAMRTVNGTTFGWGIANNMTGTIYVNSAGYINGTTITLNEYFIFETIIRWGDMEYTLNVYDTDNNLLTTTSKTITQTHLNSNTDHTVYMYVQKTGTNGYLHCKWISVEEL